MSANIVVDAMPEDELAGIVTKIAPTSTTAGVPGQASGVVKYEVEVEITNSDDSLKSGMSAKCTMVVLDEEDLLILPRQYVGREDSGEYFVLVAPADKEDRKARRSSNRQTSTRQRGCRRQTEIRRSISSTQKDLERNL